MGLLTKDDSTLYRNFFKEMAYLRGISVKYSYPVDIDTSIHGEIRPINMSTSIDIDIIFEENPSVSTLKTIGWISEDPNDKPYIAYLPFGVENLSTKCVIDIPPFIEINSRSRKFEITSIKTIIEFPDAWICTLAPIFDTDITDNNYNESNYNYVESEDQPDKDTVNNKPNNSYYQYIKED